jgi:uncharacterized protein (TIGR02246 family)
LVLTGCVALPSQARAQDEEVDKEVMRTFEKLAKAFNSADAKALAALWSEKAEYLSEDTGERLEGRKAIEEDFAKILGKKKPARLEIDIFKARAVGGNVMSVDGEARVIRPKEAIQRSRFLALLVKSGAGWLIDSVRESDLPEAESNYEQLKELAWLDGTWKHRDGDLEIVLVCDWVANGNFRSHRFTVTRGGETIHEGTQVIGWDPIKKQIRSWVFSSDGSFGDGVWEKSGKRWTAKVAGVSIDGQATAARQIITQLDEEHFTWQVVDRSVGARLLPNAEEIAYGKTGPAPSEKKGD